jgi:glycosyltransferase involved in cell wall biosynthesis
MPRIREGQFFQEFMLIGIDCRTALAPKTGDRTYLLNLLRGLAELDLDPAQWQFHLLLDAPDDNEVLPRTKYFRPVIVPAANSRLWTLWQLPLYAQQNHLNGVHVQYLAPPWLPCRFVSTIHDVVWRAYPQTFPALHRAIMRHGMPGTARRAARVICGTESAGHDIQKYLRVPRRKIAVTPYAIDPAYFLPMPPPAITAVREKYHIGSAPYVLSVGVQQPRKNVRRLIEAFLLFKQCHPNAPHRLVITGKAGWGEENQKALSHEDLVFTGYVEDDELPPLYAGAALFAYPSLYEGFGLPILEAAASGCAVLTSDRGAMSEVAGDAAHLVDPYSVASLMDGLEKVLLNPVRQAGLARRGRERAAEFTLQRQAITTLDVYQRAFGKRRS